MNLFKQKTGQSLVETAIIFPVILLMILAILQITIFITCQLSINFAAFKAARAVLLSSNTSKYYGFGNNNSILQDARKSVRSTLMIFYPGIGLGWMMPAKVSLYRHSGRMKNGVAENPIRDKSIPQRPNRTIWVVVKADAIIVIPMMQSLFGKFLGLTKLKKVTATCLVDTPSAP